MVWTLNFGYNTQLYLPNTASTWSPTNIGSHASASYINSLRRRFSNSSCLHIQQKEKTNEVLSIKLHKEKAIGSWRNFVFRGNPTVTFVLKVKNEWNSCKTFISPAKNYSGVSANPSFEENTVWKLYKTSNNNNRTRQEATLKLWGG